MNRIKELREAQGWSQKELGRLLDCSAMAVSRYERDDDKLYPSLVRRMAGVFRVKPSEILGWDEMPPLDTAMLAQALLLSEQWLSRQNSLPDSQTKARIAAALYETALRDRDAGGAGQVKIEPLEPVLRLLLPA
jgi:transcriptional regulator with XRE-family HTH domain